MKHLLRVQTFLFRLVSLEHASVSCPSSLHLVSHVFPSHCLMLPKYFPPEQTFLKRSRRSYRKVSDGFGCPSAQHVISKTQIPVVHRVHRVHRKRWCRGDLKGKKNRPRKKGGRKTKSRKVFPSNNIDNEKKTHFRHFPTQKIGEPRNLFQTYPT